MRRTILLADDSSTIQRLVTQTFADGDFEIVSVSNGDAAIKKFEDIVPSVVLADIYMPGKNGYEVCAYVKNHPSRSSTPVVLLVGAFDAFDEANGKQVGASASIIKPFEPRALIDLVRSVMLPESQVETPSPVRTPLEPAPVVRAAPEPVPVAVPQETPVAHSVTADESDILGLSSIFKPEPAHTVARAAAAGITEEEIERIADRVIQRLSVQVIENIAWDIVPDITEKIVREELKRTGESGNF